MWLVVEFHVLSSVGAGGWGQEGVLCWPPGGQQPLALTPHQTAQPDARDALGKVKGDTCYLASSVPFPGYFKYPLSEALPWNLFSSVMLLTQPGVGLSEVINLSI